MKRAKFLVALVTIASLVLGAFSMVYAADTDTAAADAAAAVEYEALDVTSKTYFVNNKDLGVYPIVSGMDDMNAKIYEHLFKTYANFEKKGASPDAYAFNLFKSSFKVEGKDTDRYAVVVVTYYTPDATDKLQPIDEVTKYYVDKEGMKELTEDEYKAALEALEAKADAVEEEAAAEEEEAAEAEEAAEPEEAVMVPIRDAIAPLGFELSWDGATKSVTVTKGDFSTVVTVDVNAYEVNGETVELDSAPLFEEGKVYVPISFLEKVLGATVVVDEEGNVEITIEEAAEEEAVEEEAAEEEAAEEEAAE